VPVAATRGGARPQKESSMRPGLVSLALATLLALPLHAQEAPQVGQDQPPPAGDGEQGVESKAVEVAASDDPDAVDSASTTVPLDEIRRYVGVYNAVKQAYVDPIDDRKLMQSAIRGLLLDLDPHSTYFERRDAEAFDEGTSGAYGGIGVEVMQLPDGSVRVIAPIDGTPAARAGIKPGDIIVAVDGKPLTPASNDGHGPLRGEPGTSARLTVVREGAAKPIEVDVERERIRVASVRGRMLEPGFGYVRISAFQVDTAADFQRVLGRLQTEAGGRLGGLVLDLRSNPGGLLTSAVQISTRGRIPISDATFSATPGDRLRGAPVVVLVDAGSASASEVLAGALHDNGRARVVGSRTFGKGSVQTVLPLDNGDSVKLTTARYFTPNGTSIQARGIEPDVVLRPAGTDATPSPVVAEALLPGHLRGDGEPPGANAGDVLEGEAPIAAALAELKRLAAAAGKPARG
jgi:carboxyl-terminal processing protease